MRGTEKQIKWAEDIRNSTFNPPSDWYDWPGWVSGRVEELRSEDVELAEYVEFAIEAIRTEESASWWIDHRRDALPTLIKERLREMGIDSIAIDAIGM